MRPSRHVDDSRPQRLSTVGAMALSAMLACVGACLEDDGTVSASSDASATSEGSPAPTGIPREVLAEQEELARRMATLPDTEGSGPYPALKEIVPELPAHVIYRPRALPAVGAEKLGLYVFGNGGCSDDGASSRLHLLEVASHGYIAIAPGQILNGPGVAAPPPAPPPDPTVGALPPAPTEPGDLIAALDWALAENQRPESPFFDRLDPAQVAVSGYSCGGLQALAVAADPRIATLLIMNSGILPSEQPPLPGADVSKETLAQVRVPILYILGGPDDIAYANGMDDFARLGAVPAAVANIDVGHGGTYWEPNGGEAAMVAVDWLSWILRGDDSARQRFVGDDCGLCTDPLWTYEQKNLESVP
jgi:hypothetical protein